MPNIGRVRRGPFGYQRNETLPKKKLGYHPTKEYKFDADDGYDSDDLDQETIGTLVEKAYKPRTSDLVAAPNPNLKYGRLLMHLLESAAGIETDYNDVNNDGEFHMNYRFYLNIVENTQLRERIKAYLAYLQTACAIPNLAGATNLMGDDGRVYHIHNHPEAGAVTRDTLEGYLEGHIGDLDKDAVPCYWQPDPADPSKNCTKKLDRVTVRAIVSEEFWQRYSKKIEIPIRAGLNSTIDLYDTILTNEKKKDSIGFGDIYERSMCPFCLQYESRESGCAYLSHKNEKRESNKKAPYCQAHFQNTALWQKYLDAARRLDPDAELAGYTAVGFCVECGRPCANHKHFTLSETAEGLAFEPEKRKPNPRNPAQMVIDYGACAGGGRPELYARILAVREVYANTALNKPAEERKAATEAAERAARDPAYIARGRAIFEKEMAERKWDVEIPSKKTYNDPAYADASDEKEDDDNNNNNNNNSNAESQNGGKRHRYTYKNRKALRRGTRVQKRK